MADPVAVGPASLEIGGLADAVIARTAECEIVCQEFLGDFAILVLKRGEEAADGLRDSSVGHSLLLSTDCRSEYRGTNASYEASRSSKAFPVVMSNGTETWLWTSFQWFSILRKA